METEPPYDYACYDYDDKAAADQQKDQEEMQQELLDSLVSLYYAGSMWSTTGKAKKDCELIASALGLKNEFEYRLKTDWMKFKERT